MTIDKLELTRKIVDELNDEIGFPTILVYPNKRKKVTLTSSKFGGLPYWDNSQAYPTDKDGNKLKLLAQFNLDEISECGFDGINVLPKSGILQFFLLSGNDYLYGSDMDDYTNNNCFRVIYHSSIKNITTEDVLALGIPTALVSATDYEPITGEIGLDFKVARKANPESMDFKNKFIEKASSYGWEINGTGNCVSDNLYSCLYSCLEEADVVNELDYCTAIEENCLLGYPTYTQLGDPRFEDNRYSKYDTQLFQMVSYNEEGTKFMAIWGDMGIAHFFINHEKLLNKDFSDVMYYWDCS